MRIRPSKNKHAVRDARYAFSADQGSRVEREDGALRGPRGIVNARRLGLSKRYRAKRMPKRKVLRPWQRASIARELREQSEKAAAQ